MPLKRRFAEGTTVAAAKSQGECRNLIERHGSDLFSSGWRNESTEVIGFRWRGRFYRFDVVHPPGEHGQDPPLREHLSDPRDFEMHDRWKLGRYYWSEYCKREVMRRWRVLLSLILEPLFKLALEEEGDEAERMFLPFAILSDGSTVAETMEPQLTIMYENGKMPALGAGS